MDRLTTSRAACGRRGCNDLCNQQNDWVCAKCWILFCSKQRTHRRTARVIVRKCGRCSDNTRVSRKSNANDTNAPCLMLCRTRILMRMWLCMMVCSQHAHTHSPTHSHTPQHTGDKKQDEKEQKEEKIAYPSLSNSNVFKHYRLCLPPLLELVFVRLITRIPDQMLWFLTVCCCCCLCLCLIYAESVCGGHQQQTARGFGIQNPDHEPLANAACVS